MSHNSQQYSVLFVCLGNICRSPTAEGIFRQKAQNVQLDTKLLIDSAGTSAHHIGEPADHRSQQAASIAGYNLNAIHSRQVIEQDFYDFDLIIAMDKANYKTLINLSPLGYQEKIKLFLQDYATDIKAVEVPDPYYGGANGFKEVIKLIEQASEGLLSQLKGEISLV